MTRDELISILPELTKDYRPAPDVLAKIGNLILLIIIGPSGGGKTTVIRELGLPYVRSDNTRPPRPDEREGVDYFFRSDYEQVAREIKDGRFVQVAVDSGGDLKATRASSYPDNGLAVMAVVADVVPLFRELGFKKTISAFIAPPNHEEWMRRLDTHLMTSQERQKRLAEARRSFKFALSDQDVHLILCETPQMAAAQINTVISGHVDVPRENAARQAASECLDRLN